MRERNERRYPREKRRISARLAFAWGVLEGTIENIGEGGVFFVTETFEGSVAEGDPAKVTFRDSGADPDVHLTGEVLRIERYFQEGRVFRAFAIRFDTPYRPVRT